VPKKKKELAKEIREKAAPLLNWLRTAEEESSSEDEDDDVEVEYSSKATGDSIMTAESQPAEVEEGEAGPDFDIDAI
jgi:translation initiation factor 5